MKENVNMADNNNSSEQQVSAEAGKDEKGSDGIILPVLVEFAFTFSVILLILLFLTIIIISLLTGTKLFDIVIRTGVTMLVIGGLLVFISRQLFLGVSNARFEYEESDQQQYEEEVQ